MNIQRTFYGLALCSALLSPAAQAEDTWQLPDDMAAYQVVDITPLPQRVNYTEITSDALSPLTLSGSWIAATDQPDMGAPMSAYDQNRLTRLDQEMLNSKLAGKAWQSATLQTEFRLLPPEKNKGMFSPFLIGGISMTKVDTQVLNTTDQENQIARGWRYGGGFAYSWSTVLDIKMGYQASAMPAVEQTRLADAETEEWRTQVFDVSVAYKF